MLGLGAIAGVAPAAVANEKPKQSVGLGALACGYDHKGRSLMHPFVLRDGEYRRVKPEEVREGDEMIMVGVEGGVLLGCRKILVGSRPHEVNSDGIIQVWNAKGSEMVDLCRYDCMGNKFKADHEQYLQDLYLKTGKCQHCGMVDTSFASNKEPV